jgi:Ca2+-transporting ATPase
MITGDHAATAQAIAEEIGIKRSDKDLVFSGVELDRMSDRELEKVAANTAAVYTAVWQPGSRHRAASG